MKAIYRFNAIHIKIPTQLFIELEKSIYKLIWNNKKSRLVKTILNKITSDRITIPDFKLYYITIVVETSWYWYNDWQVGEWNRTKDPEMNPHTT